MNHAIALPAEARLDSHPMPTWLDRGLYPFESRSFGTADGTMRYLDEGNGRPVVLVHGTPSWSFEWRKVISGLRTTHRVVAPDHLGFGLSDKPGDASILTPERHAERLAQLLRSLDLRDAVMVVHDFGGPIGLGAALLGSQRVGAQRVGAIVASNTFMSSLSHRADVRRLSWVVGSPLGRLLYLGLNASPRWIVPAALGSKTKLSREEHRHYTAPFPSWGSRLAPWKLGVELAGSSSFYDRIWQARETFASLPSRIVWGGADPTFKKAELVRLREGLPKAKVEVLGEVGHFPAEESPEAIIDAVRSLDG